MKKILFLVSCSVVAFNFNNTFASQNNEDEDFQTALKLSREEYDRENAEPIIALTETEKRPTTLPDLNEKAAEENQEKSDEFYLNEAATIIKTHLSIYEDALKYATHQEKSQYYHRDEVRSIPAIIYDLENDGDNTLETRLILDCLNKELEERGERYQLFKPQKNDYIREIAQQLNISSEKATRVYKLIIFKNDKAVEETNEKSDDFYVFQASNIIKHLLKNYETNLIEATQQEKSQYYPPDEVKPIPDIIHYLEHDGENNEETSLMLDFLRREREERGERRNLFKPQKNDYIREIAQQLNISSEKATRVYKLIIPE